MKRNMYEWVQQTIAAEKKKGLLVLSFPAIQKMGITVDELVKDSDLQAKAMKIVAELTPDAAASVSMMDLSLEAEAFGSTIRYSKDEVPTVIGSIVDSEEAAEELEIPEIGAGRTQIYIDAIEKAVRLIDDRPIFAGTIGPFSLAGRLMDVTEAMYYCYDEPDMVHTILDKVSSFLIKYMNAYKAIGANGIVMAEPLAGLLAPDQIDEFSTQYVHRIVDAVQTEDFLVVYHNCGSSTVACIDSILTSGCKAFHFGNAIDMADMMPHIPGDRIAMGNVDPARVFRNGSPDRVKKETLALLERCGKYPNFIVSSGCDIPPLSSWDNITAFFDAVSTYYAAKA